MSALLSVEIRWLLKQARPYLFLQIASLVCITVGSWLYLLDPLILKWLLDKVLPNHSMGGLAVALGLIFACYVGRVLLTSAGGLLTNEASQKLVLRLRTNLLRHLDTLSSDYHDVTSVGSRFYLFMEPMDEIGQLGADLVPAILRTLVMTLSVLAAMIWVNAHLTFAIVPLVPLFLYVRHRFRKRLRAQADSVQQQQSAVSTFLQEHLAAIPQLQLLRAEKRQEHHAFRRFAGALRAQFRLWRTAAGYGIASEGTTAIGMIIVLGIGGREYFLGSLTIGGLVAFYTYLTRLFEPLSGAVKLYSRLQQVGASIRKVMGAFDLRPSIVQSQHAVYLRKNTSGRLEFDRVCFAYPGGRPLLHDLSFQVRPGARIGIIGTNGSGKSTSGKLVTRLYEQQSGSIRIDGVDVRELNLRNLRDLVCLLPQSPLLFETSLIENLRFGSPDATDEEIAWAVELAELNGVAARFERGLLDSVGPLGNLLSGGEKQRLAIARAVLQKPRILILDEATSSLDARTEERILARVVRRLDSTSVLLISHHASALRWMDELLLLRAGRIVERCRPALVCQNIVQFLSPKEQESILEEASLVDDARASD